MILLLGALAFAENIAGIEFPNHERISDVPVVLNGAGLREKYWIDIYAAGLYLPTQSDNADEIIKQETAKRIKIVFIYPRVTKEQMIETLEENFEQNPNISEETRRSIGRCTSWMEDFNRDDEIVFDYVPEQGTTIYVKGKKKGTIPGSDFMNAVYTIYLGPSPASKPLKASLIGH